MHWAVRGFIHLSLHPPCCFLWIPFFLAGVVVVYWTGPGGSTPQISSCTATYHPSRKLSKLDKPDMQDTDGEVGTSSSVMYSYASLHMAKQKQGNQLKPTYSSSVRIWGVALRTCQKRWMIGRGGERWSGISLQMVRQDDDDTYLIIICLHSYMVSSIPILYS